jgi:hypothetical protein
MSAPSLPGTPGLPLLAVTGLLLVGAIVTLASFVVHVLRKDRRHARRLARLRHPSRLRQVLDIDRTDADQLAQLRREIAEHERTERKP